MTTPTKQPSPSTDTRPTSGNTPKPSKRIGVLRRLSKRLQQFSPIRRRVGDYVFIQVVGQGGFGKVVSARHDDKPTQEVAIKIQQKKRFSRCFRELPDSSDALSMEIGTLRMFANHQNIIKLHDVIETRSATYIVMEKARMDLSQGLHGLWIIDELALLMEEQNKYLMDFARLFNDIARTQHDMLQECTPTLQGAAVRTKRDTPQQLMKGILSGLQRLHEHGICHRDLKPHNIVLCYDPSTSQITAADVRLCDFGSASSARTLYTSKEADGFLDNKSFAPRKNVWCYDRCGTPSFMAPEVFDMLELMAPYEGRRADMWSVGLVLEWIMYGDIDKEFYKPIPNGTKAEAEKFKNHLRCELKKKKCAWASVGSDELELANELQISLMSPLPRERTTAPQALKHPWIQFHD